MEVLRVWGEGAEAAGVRGDRSSDGRMVEEMAEAAAKASVEETVEVVAVVSPGLELARAESTMGGGDAEALNKGWVACRASPLPSSSARVSESEGEEEGVAIGA
jgi:hypothetical protein